MNDDQSLTDALRSVAQQWKDKLGEPNLLTAAADAIELLQTHEREASARARTWEMRCDNEVSHIAELKDQISSLRAGLAVAIDQRDEARREVCERAVGWKRAGMRVQNPQQYAQERGWNCFKEETDDGA